MLGSGTLEGVMIARGKPITEMLPFAAANMWVPGLACILTRLIRREGFGDVSFRIRGPGVLRELLVGWLYPLPVAFLAYGVAWATGLAHFRGSAGGFATSLGIALTLVTVINSLATAGEEIGWRGYMLPRMVEAGVPYPLVVSSVIWGLWHVPLILSGQYASGPMPALSALLFVIGILPEGYVIGRLRLASGSVWPAVMMHASWNSVVQGPFDGHTTGGGAAHADSIWIGESGILVVIAGVIVATLSEVALRRSRRARAS